MTIHKEENPVCTVSIWRSYLLNRLSGLQLKRINEQAITFEDLNSANRILASLSNLAIELPEYRLLSILGKAASLDNENAIKVAKTSYKVVPTLKHILAREKVIDSVMTSHQEKFEKSWIAMQRSALQSNKPDKTRKSFLLEDYFVRTKDNKQKRRILKEAKKDIWCEFVDEYFRKKNFPQKHVKNLCKQNKITF